MKAVIGIGDPDLLGCRANIGHAIVDAFAQRHGFTKFEPSSAIQGLEYTRYSSTSYPAMLLKSAVKPSMLGELISRALHIFDIEEDDIIVVHYDIDFPLGQIRIKDNGGDGGNEGVQSIAHSLKSNDFKRLRVGINSFKNRFKKTRTEFVGEPFEDHELPLVLQALSNSTKAIDSVFSAGLRQAQKKYHATQPTPPPLPVPDNHPSKSPLMLPPHEDKKKIAFSVEKSEKKDFKITVLPKSEANTNSNPESRVSQK